MTFSNGRLNGKPASEFKPHVSGLFPGSGQAVPVRDPQLQFEKDIERYWFLGNPVVTHGFNGFNLIIPEYERFFVRSVARLRHWVTDPVLLEQIKGFSGQEVMHAKAHEAYFQWMRQQGYRIDRFLDYCGRYARWMEKISSAKLNIACTAAAEHYTASIGHLLLTEPHLMDHMHPTMRRFVIWHSAEEVEHKAVSFDVLQAAGGGYGLRIAAYLLVSVDVLIFSVASAYMLLRQDGFSLWQMYQQKRRFRKLYPDLPRKFRGLILAYFRKDFHPNNLDELELAHGQLKQLGLFESQLSHRTSND